MTAAVALPTQPVVELHWLAVGRCRQLEALSRRGGRWARVDFPSHVGVIRHPEAGWVLVDTGYAPGFFAATQRLPERLYRALLPVTLPDDQRLTARLAALGITPDEVSRVVVTHWHADHVSGLPDLPRARISAARAGVAHAQGLRGVGAVRHGVLTALLPDDLGARLDPVDDQPGLDVAGFTAHDVLGDASVLAVELPGHVPGHLGVLVTTTRGPALLVGDAAWSLRSVDEVAPPSRLAGAAVDDADTALATLRRLHGLRVARPDLALLPSHCAVAARSWDAR